MTTETAVPDSAPDVNPTVARGLIRYVEAALGTEALKELLASVPGDQDVMALMKEGRWWTLDEFAHLVIAAYEATGDTDLGRRVGEQVFRDTLGGNLAEMILACGTSEVACKVMAEYSARMATGRLLAVVDSSESHVLLEATYLDGEPDPFAHGFTMGYFAALPSLFGDLGTVAELTCRMRGGDSCQFRVAWRPDPSRTDMHALTPEDRMVRGYSAIEQLEGQNTMAAHLVDVQEIGDVLDRIVRNVHGLVGAPRYVLSVRVDDGAGRRVHHVGFDGDDAEILMDMLEAGERLGDEYLVVRVRHGDRTFGHLIAVSPVGARASEVDERILRSYAAFAGSAIQIVESLEAARRDRDTAQALLTLAAALAESGDHDAVARNLCGSIPGASGCDIATVWLLDPAEGVAKLADARDKDGTGLTPEVALTSIEIASLIAHGADCGQPFLLDASEVPSQLVCGGTSLPISEAVVVPIGNGEHVVGFAAAAFVEPISSHARPAVMARLGGLADQAVVALENARLVQEMKYQALHDDLTGLPKRALAEDRCRLALAGRARTGSDVAVLFLDVDDFKAVNDSYGHAVGDVLLQELAARVIGQLRATDTCARVGGDEFVVILGDLSAGQGAHDVAARILAVADAPFDLGELTLDVSVSIGVAMARAEDSSFAELVKRADDAMYQAKANGKGRFAVVG